MRFRLLNAVSVFALVGITALASAQQDRSFRNPRAPERIAMTKTAIDSLERDSRALRKALVDSALGTPVWLEFSFDQQAAERRAGTIDAVVSQFLARHRTALGLTDPGIELREAEREVDGEMVHVRFRQYWRRLPVKGGELRLHLRQTARGYVVETANGRLHADVDARENPAFGPSVAAGLALARFGGEPAMFVDSMPDGPLALLPYESGYRLIYSVTGTRWRATVDAVSGEILDTGPTFNTFGRSATGGARGRVSRNVLATSRPRPRSRLQAGYVNGSGVDALNVPYPLGAFKVYQNGASFELRSNQLGAYVSEVVVREAGGQDVASCGNFPLATSGSFAWPEELFQRQQVSAMVNGLGAGRFYKDSLGRRSYDDALPGSPIVTCVNTVFRDDFLNEVYGAGSFPDNTLAFGRDAAQYLGAAASKDVVTHEFTHNVARDESVAQQGGPGACDDGWPSNEPCAVNEALADYFGARHRRNACIGNESYYGGACIRNLGDFLTYSQGQPLEGHNFGRVFGGALWQVASISNPIGKDLDNATHNAIKFYLLQDARMLYSREGIVRAAQDRQHANQNLAAIVPHVENAFASRGIGYPAVSLAQGVSQLYQCGWKFSLTVGSVNRRYSVTFESGSGMNNDQSVANVNYSVQLEPFAFRYGNRTFDYPTVLVNGHQSDDGHVHAFRVRFNDGMLGVAGLLLDYYVGWLPVNFCYAFPEGPSPAVITGGAGRVGAPPPARLTVRQSVPVEPEISLSGSAPTTVGAPGLAAQVIRSGIMAFEVGVPVGASGSPRIRVYDLRGRLVRTIASPGGGPGWSMVVWDGRDDAGGPVAPGVYVALVQAGAQASRTRLIVPAR